MSKLTQVNEVDIDKVDTFNASIAKAAALSHALLGQLKGHPDIAAIVESPISQLDQCAIVERILALIAEADQVAGDLSMGLDVRCHRVGCLARLIESWLATESAAPSRHVACGGGRRRPASKRLGEWPRALALSSSSRRRPSNVARTDVRSPVIVLVG